MSDEKRIFTHPGIVQAGSYGRQYKENLVCSSCQRRWGSHFGWGCDETVASLPELPTATVSTTCARCSATIDSDAVEQHHERCFVVGDAVRLDIKGLSDLWTEGEIVDRTHDGKLTMKVVRHGPGWTSSAIGSLRYAEPTEYRYIQRPGQAVTVNTPSGPITLRPDPTLKPGEFRFEQPDHELQDATARELCEGCDMSPCVRKYVGCIDLSGHEPVAPHALRRPNRGAVPRSHAASTARGHQQSVPDHHACAARRSPRPLVTSAQAAHLRGEGARAVERDVLRRGCGGLT